MGDYPINYISSNGHVFDAFSWAVGIAGDCCLLFRMPAKMTGLFYATFIPLADAFAMSGSVVAPVLLSESGIGAGGLMIGTLIAVPIVVSSAVLLRSQRPPSPFADGSDGS